MHALARGLLQIGFAWTCSAISAGAPVVLTASSCNPLIVKGSKLHHKNSWASTAEQQITPSFPSQRALISSAQCFQVLVLVSLS